MNGQKTGFSAASFIGKIIDHTPEISFDIPESIYGLSLDYVVHSSERPWQKFWNAPVIHVQGIYTQFNDAEILGHALSIVPSLDFKLIGTNSVSLRFSVGTGLAYINKKYSSDRNPLNNAIGSHWNNNTQFNLGLKASLSEKLSVSLSGGLLHYSNGLFQSPNAGINIYFGELKTTFYFSRPEKLNNPAQTEKTRTKRARYLVNWDVGISSDKNVYGSKRYAISSVSFFKIWHHNDYMRLLFGPAIEYNFWRKRWLGESPKEATSISLAIAEEFMFGDLSARLKLGTYLQFPSARKEEPVYFNLSTQYYFSLDKKEEIRAFVGVSLKTHWAVAEYLGFNTGISF